MFLYKKLVRVLMIFTLVSMISFAANAQQGPFGPDPNSDVTPQPAAPDPGGDPAPIDGGLSILLAAGVGYGIKKYRNNRKNQNEEEIK